ncbi:hypothetical protein ABZO31_17075 [Streptomyces sp. HUAS MG47]|uniref:hypothetical protein n=1 Tax=Streptomyces solicamelliae TaxID=3231716 RepID=UPI0038782EB7
MNTTMKSKTIAVLAPVTVALALGGCSAQEEAGPDERKSALRAQAALDASRENKQQVQDAELKLIRRCMVQKGFTVFPADGGTSAPPAERSYGSPSLETAKKIGYGLDPRRASDDKTTPADSDAAFDALPNSRKAAHTLAMYGPDDEQVTYEFGSGKVSIGKTGCMADVRRELYGDLKTYLRLHWIITNTVNSDTGKSVAKDEGVKNALESWSSCMDKARHSGVDAPDDAREKASKDYEGLGPGDEKALDKAQVREIDIAVDDATCAQSSKLNQSLSSARAEAAAKVLSEHESEIIAWRDLMSKASGNAQRLLRKSS